MVVVDLALDLEISCIEIIVLDILGEVEHDIVADIDDTVLRLRSAEDGRAACVLDTTEHLGRGCQIAVAIAAEEHGTEVVSLLHDDLLAEEPGDDGSVLGDHLLDTVGQCIERITGVISTEVGPELIATCGLLVLELDMVEVLLVLVETIDDDRQVVAILLVILSVGVEDPLVARRCDIDRTSCAEEVHVERSLAVGEFLTVDTTETDNQILIVEVLSGIHLESLLGDLSRKHLDGTSCTTEGHAVDQQLGTLRVGSLLHIEVIVVVGILRLLRLIGEIEFEASRLGMRHTADGLLIELDDRILDFLCSLVEQLARLIEQGAALVLPWAAGSTTASAVDEATRILRIAEVEMTFEEILVVVHLIVEILAGEDIHLVLGHIVGDNIFDAIDIEAEVALEFHADGEALLAAIGIGSLPLGFHIIGKRRSEAKLEERADELDFATKLRAGVDATCGSAQDAAQELGHCRADHLYDGKGSITCSTIEIAVGESRNGPHHGVHARVIAAEFLLIADATHAAVDDEVAHQVIGGQFLTLVLCDHADPRLEACAILLHLVGEIIVFHVRRHDDAVVHAALFSHTAGIAVVLSVFLVHHAEVLLIRWIDESEIDRFARSIGLGLSLGQRTCEHERLTLVDQSWDQG